MKCLKCSTENTGNAIYCYKCNSLLASAKTVIDKNATFIDNNRTFMDSHTIIENGTIIESKNTVFENRHNVDHNNNATNNNRTTISSISSQGSKKILKGWLVCLSEDLKYKDYPLYSGQNTIGRSSKNSILISHQTVSSEHAVIWCDENAVTIADKDSTNGLILNGERIFTRKNLNCDDHITIGDIVVQYVSFLESAGV